jgi:hypothetical protein
MDTTTTQEGPMPVHDLRSLLNLAASIEGLPAEAKARLVAEAFGADYDETLDLVRMGAPASTLPEVITELELHGYRFTGNLHRIAEGLPV